MSRNNREGHYRGNLSFEASTKMLNNDKHVWKRFKIGNVRGHGEPYILTLKQKAKLRKMRK